MHAHTRSRNVTYAFHLQVDHYPENLLILGSIRIARIRKITFYLHLNNAVKI